MAYATPTLYLRRFGLAEAVMLLADEEGLLTATLLQEAIAGAFTGTPSRAEQDAATQALARLERQLDVASSYMDGYLRAVATLPLPADNANAGTLEECCLALARHGVADDADNATERLDEAAKTWRAWLKDVSLDRVKLVGVSGEAASSAGRVRTGQATSAVPWGLFGGVR